MNPVDPNDYPLGKIVTLCNSKKLFFSNDIIVWPASW